MEINTELVAKARQVDEEANLIGFGVRSFEERESTKFLYEVYIVVPGHSVGLYDKNIMEERGKIILS